MKPQFTCPAKATVNHSVHGNTIRLMSAQDHIDAEARQLTRYGSCPGAVARITGMNVYRARKIAKEVK